MLPFRKSIYLSFLFCFHLNLYSFVSFYVILYFYLFLYPSLSLSILLSTTLSFNPSLFLSFCLLLYPSIYLFFYPSVYYTILLSTTLSFNLSLYPSLSTIPFLSLFFHLLHYYSLVSFRLYILSLYLCSSVFQFCSFSISFKYIPHSLCHRFTLKENVSGGLLCQRLR